LIAAVNKFFINIISCHVNAGRPRSRAEKAKEKCLAVKTNEAFCGSAPRPSHHNGYICVCPVYPCELWARKEVMLTWP